MASHDGETFIVSGRSLAASAHDFRSRLNIIIGFSELLLDEVPGKINPEQRQSLTDILNSAISLLALLDAAAGKTVNKSFSR